MPLALDQITVSQKKKGGIANGFIQDDGKEYRKSKNTVPFDLSGYPSVK